MDKNKLIVANLKMNKTMDEIVEYLKVINKEIHTPQVVICPTSIYIPYFLKQGYQVGVQNIAPASEGAYTGEISPKHVACMGVRYAIIGHSERRTLFHEDDELIHKKIEEAIHYNLKVIVCVGETEEEKNMHKTNIVIKRQIVHALRGLEPDMLDNVILAYEPVWAIGSNRIPSNQDIHDVIDYMKDIVKVQFSYLNIPVLYGGSINEKNITTLNTIENVSGFLIGGASLDPDKLKYIIEVAVPR